MTIWPAAGLGGNAPPGFEDPSPPRRELPPLVWIIRAVRLLKARITVCCKGEAWNADKA